MKKCYVWATFLLLGVSALAQHKIDFEELSFPEGEKYWNGANGEGQFTSKNATFNNSFNNEWQSWSGFAYSKMTDASTPGFLNQYSVFAPKNYWNGSDESGGFELEGVSFTNEYNPEWGSWSGFSYSNETDNETEGFGNQFSAITGEGVDGDNYLIYTQGGEITFDAPYQISEFKVTNTTYAYFSMLNGDDFANQFQQDDWFLLTIYGWDEQGELLEDSVNFYLADFQDQAAENHFILSEWSSVDLSILGEVSKLTFNLTSSDVGEWGMNTPNYFALGKLSIDNGDEDDLVLDFDELGFPSTGNNGSENYAIWYADGLIQFDSLVEMESIAIANTTFAALSMRDGDEFTTKFEQDDWFRLTIYGWDENETQIEDSVVVYLADFRDEDVTKHYILDEWMEVDLSVFEFIQSLSFKLESSDIGEWGMNTPNYFALDDVVYHVLEVEDNLSTEDQDSFVAMSVYPNPASSFLKIDAPDGFVELVDLNGRRIVQMEHLGHTSISTVDLPKGTYVLHWSDGVRTEHRKIVVL